MIRFLKGLRGITCLAVVAAIAVCGTPKAHAQAVGGQQQAGVYVDADGVLHKKVYRDSTRQLAKQRIAAARARLNGEVVAKSPLRKVSLVRLEEALRKNLAEHSGVSEEMSYLAGLTRIEYVYCYPESNDIVIAGPAEGWTTDASGRVRGIFSGRPVLELQDLVVALRAFPPGDQATHLIGCSIDPTPEGLARMQRFLREFGSRATPRDTKRIVASLRRAMGMQNVRIDGIPTNTHFAQVMVEADYRMKLIGIGLEKPPVRLASYVDRASPSQVSRNAMERWYFMPEYDCVRVSDDELAMQLVGDGVKLVNEGELITAAGERRQMTGGNRASRAFTHEFTKKYAALADRSPVYAQLRNLIDLTIAACFLQQYDYYGRAGWSMELLGSEANFGVETYIPPQQVATVVTSVWKGNRLMTPVGGGVSIVPKRALDTERLLHDDEGALSGRHSTLRAEIPDGRWWWD